MKTFISDNAEISQTDINNMNYVLEQFQSVQTLLQGPDAHPGMSDYAREIDQNIIDLQNNLNSINNAR